MSLTALLFFSILGMDFFTYYWFHRIFGDNRDAVAREGAVVRAQRSALPGPAKGRFSNAIRTNRSPRAIFALTNSPTA